MHPTSQIARFGLLFFDLGVCFVSAKPALNIVYLVDAVGMSAFSQR